jgi:hypothetical protein
MNTDILALIILAALIGLNYLARNPRAQGRGWRVSRMLTRFAVPAAILGVVVVWVNVELEAHFHYWSLEPSARAPFDVALIIGAFLYLVGHLGILASLLTRTWLRFDAYLRRVGPKSFDRNVGHLAWTVGKSGIKLYAMAVAAFAALHLVGLRNLALLGFLKGTLNSGSAGARDDRRREEGGRHTGASSAS